MDSDLDAYSSDCDSVLSDDKVEKVEKELKSALKFPMMCPVCLGGGYSFRNFRTQHALLQHANDKAVERSEALIKLRPFHVELIQKIRDAVNVEMNAQKSQSRSRMTPAVRTREIGDDQLHVHKIDEDIRGLAYEKHEIDTQREKRVRQVLKTTSNLEETKWQLAVRRQKTQEIRDLANREVDREAEELKSKVADQTASLRTLTKAKDALKKKLDEPAETMTPQQKDAYTTELMRLMYARDKTEKEKQTVEQQLKSMLIGKQEVQAAYDKMIKYAKVMDEKVEKVGKSCAPVELDDEARLKMEQLKAVGLIVSKLPAACQKCKNRFENSAKDTTKTARRVVLSPCGCVNYCQTCVSNPTFGQCPKHKERIVEAIPFTSFT